ncbi:MAG: hypothetical protein IPI85_15795 [Dehalococcoidia bacterium]|nr:hypothetical protein [Dehalococcoidia bacterium]
MPGLGWILTQIRGPASGPFLALYQIEMEDTPLTNVLLIDDEAPIADVLARARFARTATLCASRSQAWTACSRSPKKCPT